jgi:hypothetical protein
MRALAFLAVLVPALARADATLYVLMRDGRLARVHGERTEIVRTFTKPAALAARDGGRVAVLADGRAEELDGTRWTRLNAGRETTIFLTAPKPEWRKLVPGTIRAFAVTADGDTLYAATREGPLWEVKLATGARRDLGLGGWWGTLALAAAPGKLYAVTQAGKLWEIDPTAGTKQIVQMSGWEGALALAAAR